MLPECLECCSYLIKVQNKGGAKEVVVVFITYCRPRKKERHVCKCGGERKPRFYSPAPQLKLPLYGFSLKTTYLHWQVQEIKQVAIHLFVGFERLWPPVVATRTAACIFLFDSDWYSHLKARHICSSGLYEQIQIKKRYKGCTAQRWHD